MNIAFPLNPIQTLMDIAERRYPDIQFVITVYEQELTEKGAAYGYCLTIQNEGKSLIRLNACQPFGEIPLTLAHEIAHAKIDKDFTGVQVHGKEFKAEFRAIAKEYNQILKEEMGKYDDEGWAEYVGYIHIYTSRRKKAK